MPQLDPSSFSPQLVWLLITFVAMYFIMARVALPRIGQVLEERQSRIDDNLGMAESYKAEAEAAAVEYEKALTEARSQAQSVVRQVAEELAAEAAKQQDVLAEKLAVKIAAAEQSIADARTAAMENVRGIAIEVAADIASKVGGVDATDKQMESAIDSALQERH